MHRSRNDTLKVRKGLFVVEEERGGAWRSEEERGGARRSRQPGPDGRPSSTIISSEGERFQNSAFTRLSPLAGHVTLNVKKQINYPLCLGFEIMCDFMGNVLL